MQTIHRYHCEAFDETGRRIGGFVVQAVTMGEALGKASTNIEVAIRPDQDTIKVSKLKE